MPRIRSIKPEFPHDEKMALVSRDARLTFILCWTVADDDGLFRAAQRQLMGQLYPLDRAVTPAKLETWLTELVGVGVVRWRTTRDGARIGEIVKWADHQLIKNKSKSFLLGQLAPLGEDGVGISTPEGGISTSSVDSRKMSGPEPRVLSLESKSLESKSLESSSVESSDSTALVPRRPGNSTLQQVETHLAEFKVFLETAQAETLGREDTERAAIGVVFAYWAHIHNHTRARLDPKREGFIRARYRELDGDANTLLYAVDGAKVDRSLNQEGKTYNDVENIFRNLSRVERCANLCEGFREDVPHPAAVRYLGVAA